MCGIAGVWSLRGDSRALDSLAAMVRQIEHRGPDGEGLWIDRDAGVALGHRRLAIVGLGDAGRQPMHSRSSRYVIVYNGEIYNHLELRQELDVGPSADRWYGGSDTETLLAAIERWGVDETLRRVVGMFAFALWDREERTLVLARDRLGEKPLYYGRFGGTLLFGSELKALRGSVDFDASINRDVLAMFLKLGYVPQPYSIYEGVWKLSAGTYIRFSRDNQESQPVAYWSVATARDQAAANPFRGRPEQAVDELERLLRGAIAGQMLSEVPLGAFLSGGVDSSTVVAIMQSISATPVRTFSIGFREQGYDEAEAAHAVARHLGTEHTELYVSSADVLAVVPALPEIYDEPFGDSSQIPTLLVSRLARRDVTVSLSGDGGDELFLGYQRYRLLHRYRQISALFPRPVRGLLARGLAAVPATAWDGVFDAIRPLLSKTLGARANGARAHRVAEMLLTSDPATAYQLLMSHWTESEPLVLGAAQASFALAGGFASVGADVMEEAACLDIVRYLPDDILAKVDRAAMSVGLETRIPLLDHRIVEFALSLPPAIKRYGGREKWPLRALLHRHVPGNLVNRPKMGFGAPVGAWLRGPLRDWAEWLLDEATLRQQGWLDPVPVRRKWQQHVSGKCDWQYPLWDVLMFQAWLRQQDGLAQ